MIGFLNAHKRLLIFSASVVVIALAVGIYLYNDNSTVPLKLDRISPAQIPPEVVVKVGNEYIYQRDLDIEMAQQPPVATDSTKRAVLKKLTADSILIQAALKDKIATEDAATFNSPNKDYKKRVALVEEIKKTVRSNSDSISGKVISIWFWNGKVGSLGLEKSKQLAFEKISRIQTDVKSKKITIDEAVKRIQQDSSLSQLDPAYRSNASFDFQKKPDETISQNLKLNNTLQSLKEGEVTEVVLGNLKDRKTGKVTENYYSFGFVEKRINDGKYKSLRDWFESHAKNYEIKYY